MKRIAIFVFYDKDGIVDTYIKYFLEAITEHVKRLVIVCNGKLSAIGRKCLDQFTDDIFIRENTGYDAMAYKLAMTEYLGWKVLEEYDEMLLINDTFYGPLYPLAEMFEEMDSKKCNFWGITGQKEYTDYYSGTSRVFPSYIQSYFMVFRKEVLHNKMFQDYWNTFDSTSWIFSDVVGRHEHFFSQFLEQAGFSWDTYIHAEDYEHTDPQYNFIQYYHAAYQLIKEHRCPVVKKKKLASIHLINNPGELGNDAAKALSWIQKNTEYDTDMIWENLLRLYDVKELQKSLNLHYVIFEKDIPNVSHRKKRMVCCSIDPPLTKQQKEYLDLVNNDMYVWNCSSQEASGESDSVSKSMDTFMNKADSCEYVLLLVRKKEKDTGQTALRIYSSIEEQWGNLVGNNSYMESLLQLFAENKRLGVLLAPCGIHSGDFGKEIRQKLQGCLALWSRKDIFIKMKKHIDAFIKNSDRISVAELRDLFIYTAQKMGYYSADAMKASYASMAYTNMDEMLCQIDRHAKSKYIFDDFGSYLDGDMLLFCRQYSAIYVYGAGENGYRVAKLLISRGYHFSGFIVSDDRQDNAEKGGYPIYRFSEIKGLSGQAGIVISVTSKKFQEEILTKLHQAGFTHLYLLDT